MIETQFEEIDAESNEDVVSHYNKLKHNLFSLPTTVSTILWTTRLFMEKYKE